MIINIETSNNVDIIRINGRIDTITSNELETKVVEVIKSDENQVILSLDGVDYISSAGLRVLLLVGKMMKDKNRKLAIIGITGAVKEVFELSGFTSLFNIFTTEDMAIEQF